jgi:4-hydroxybenzoate polyprenyltransferase
MWILIPLLILFVIALGPVGADGAAVVRGLLLGVVVGLITAWGWMYSAGWNDRVDAEKDETIERAEERARAARR